jgi:hypothetical protein
MYDVICFSNGEKQKRFNGKSRPYITFFSKDEIIKNVILLNAELQIFATLMYGESSNKNLLISSNRESLNNKKQHHKKPKNHPKKH